MQTIDSIFTFCSSDRGLTCLPTDFNKIRGFTFSKMLEMKENYVIEKEAKIFNILFFSKNLNFVTKDLFLDQSSEILSWFKNNGYKSQWFGYMKGSVPSFFDHFNANLFPPGINQKQCRLFFNNVLLPESDSPTLHNEFLSSRPEKDYYRWNFLFRDISHDFSVGFSIFCQCNLAFLRHVIGFIIHRDLYWKIFFPFFLLHFKRFHFLKTQTDLPTLKEIASEQIYSLFYNKL